MAFAAVLSVVGAFEVLPAKPTLGQKVFGGLAALVATTIIVVIVTYVEALMVAPYQQRNALRQTLAQLRERVAELETTPVSREHADRLRQIAIQVKRCIEGRRALDFGSPEGTDSNLWRKAFIAHFPDLHEVLETIEAKGAAASALGERLIRDARAAGMDESPWLLDEFIRPMALLVESRAITGLLQAEFNFGWTESGGYMYLGDATSGVARVFSVSGPAVDVGALVREFEEFFRTAETWSEATGIREALSLRHAAEKTAVAALDVVANTDTITTRCPLCLALALLTVAL